jgi:site-specific DNA-adenine methylase
MLTHYQKHLNARYPANTAKSFFPTPGGKSGKRYNFVQLKPHHRHVVEPFAGGAALSIRLGVPCTFAESDPYKAALIWAGMTRRDISELHSSYCKIVEKFTAATSLDPKANMKTLRKEFQGVCKEVDVRWEELKQLLSCPMQHRKSYAVAGYMFMLLSSFGNIVRTDKGGEYNNPWHVSKMHGAMNFNFFEWQKGFERFRSVKCRALYSHYYDAITAKLIRPATSLLILDPPYQSHTGTPCYATHDVKGCNTMALDAATAGMNVGYSDIILFGYHHNPTFKYLFANSIGHGYDLELSIVGELNSLSNSSPGGAIDKPVEVVYTLTKVDI